MRIPCLAALIALSLTAAELTPAERKLNADCFEYAWKTIGDKMWEPMPAGVNWQKIHDELLPKVEAASTMAEARGYMRDMIARLKLTHFNIFAGDVYETVSAHAMGDGEPGFDLRLLDGEVIVSSVEPESPAARAGVRPGWRVLSVDGRDLDAAVKKVSEAYRNSTTRELLLTRSLLAGFSGARGEKIKTEFVDGQNRKLPLDIELKAPRGTESKFGYLPAQRVWFESKKFGNTGYIAFNMFLDPVHLSPQFGSAVESCMKCDGLIVDLRGNPGGLGGMAMGMSGWFISKPDQKLGVMKTKDAELKFVTTRRVETFRGPLAILTDELTASTAEIFAGGLKDLGRAYIVGTRTAGAALPSVLERLPNGDGFQYAIANYISQGGKPLEGAGVTPDEEVKLTRAQLLEGRDPVIDAALNYIRNHKEQQ